MLDLARSGGGGGAELFALLAARRDLVDAPALPADPSEALPTNLAAAAGWRPLHYAARRGAAEEVARLLDQFGANPLLLAEAGASADGSSGSPAGWRARAATRPRPRCWRPLRSSAPLWAASTPRRLAPRGR